MSENHFAWTRVGKWYYSCLNELVEVPPYEPLQKPVHHWYMPELKLWLWVRQMQYTSAMKSADLKHLVKELMERDGGPPPVIGSVGGPAVNVQTAIVALWSP